MQSQTRARDRDPRVRLSLGVHDANAAALLGEALDRAIGVYGDLVRKRRCDCAEVDDPCLRGVQRRSSRRVRLDLTELVAGETTQSGHAVLEPAPVQLVEPS